MLNGLLFNEIEALVTSDDLWFEVLCFPCLQWMTSRKNKFGQHENKQQ